MMNAWKVYWIALYRKSLSWDGPVFRMKRASWSEARQKKYCWRRA